MLEQLVMTREPRQTQNYGKVSHCLWKPRHARPLQRAVPAVPQGSQQPHWSRYRKWFTAFLNFFERTATVAGWAKSEWAALLVPWLIGLAQQAVDTLPASDLGNYQKVQVAILQTLKHWTIIQCRNMCLLVPSLLCSHAYPLNNKNGVCIIITKGNLQIWGWKVPKKFFNVFNMQILKTLTSTAMALP